jgi:hypothetical protein
MNVYALTVDYDRDAFIAALDKTPMIRNWLKVSDTLLFVATYRPLQTVVEYLHSSLSLHTFFLAEVSPSTASGYLYKPAWDFLNTPLDSWKHPADWPFDSNPPPPPTPPSPSNALGSLLNPKP